MKKSTVGIIVGVLVVLSITLMVFGEKIFRKQPETLSPDYSKKTTSESTTQSNEVQKNINNTPLSSGNSSSGFYKVSYKIDSIDMLDKPTEEGKIITSLPSGTILKVIGSTEKYFIEVGCLTDSKLSGWVDIQWLEEIYGSSFYIVSQYAGEAELYNSVEITPEQPMPESVDAIPGGTLVSAWGGETEEYIEITCDVDGYQKYGWIAKEFLEPIY